MTDEDGKRVETYTDNQDRTVLVVNVEGDDNRLETYSVLDDRGLLRYVLPPEAECPGGDDIDPGDGGDPVVRLLLRV